MAKRIAIANHKGGVGKSTTTLMLAEGLALSGYRVLVVDLDPQAMSSKMLLGESGLEEAIKQGRTLGHHRSPDSDRQNPGTAAGVLSRWTFIRAVRNSG